MSYCIFKVGTKFKDYLAIGNYEKYLKRETVTADDHVDTEKTKDNLPLKLHKKESIVEHIKDYIKDCRLRKDNVIARDIMLTASPEYFADHDVNKVYNWAKVNIDFLEKEFGNNFVYAVLHVDQNCPHIHAICCPKLQDSKGINILSNDRYFGTKFKLREWQDKYARAMEKCGLERGIRYNKTPVLKLKKFYQYLDSIDKIENINTKDIDPNFLLTDNKVLRGRNKGLEETVKNYVKYLDLEKVAHKTTKEENKELKQILEYIESKYDISIKDIEKALSKGEKAIDKSISASKGYHY